MPKIVDHDQRREEIAQALWRVIARVGFDGASVRVVADEAGWSAGAVRHYFSTQDELLRFGVELQLARIPERIRTVLAELPPGRARCQAVLELLLPLDEARLGEARVWLATLVRSRVDPQLGAIVETGWLGERHLCRSVVSELRGESWPEMGTSLPDPDAEASAERLHVFVDGLTLLGVSFGSHITGSDLRRLLGDQLAMLQGRNAFATTSSDQLS